MTKPDADITSSAGRLDPITLEIVWNGLRSINDETWITIQVEAWISWINTYGIVGRRKYRKNSR